MRRAFISYASADSDAAQSLASQLRADSIDIFIDLDRLQNPGSFTRRLENELRSRGCMILIQSPDALKSALVQTEIEFAYKHKIEVIPLILKPFNIRDTGEFRFLLTLRPIESSRWSDRKGMAEIMRQLKDRLRQSGDDTPITLRNVVNLKPSATLRKHTSWVREVTFSPDGYLLASCGNDNLICLWDIRTANRTGRDPDLIACITAHDTLVWAVEFAPRHSLLASSAGDSTVRLWEINDLPDVYELTRFTDHKAQVYALSYSPDGRLLASASHDNTVKVRDVASVDSTGRASATVTLLHTSHVYWVAFSPDGHTLASTSRDSAVRLWDYDYDYLDGLSKAKPRYLSGHTSWVNSVVFSPNGLICASAGNDGSIRLWDVQSGESFAVLEGHTAGVNSVAFSSDGSLLSSAAKDDTVRLWDLHSARELTVIRGHERGVNSVVFSPDGTKLVTGSGDSTIKIWSVVDKIL